MKSKLILEAKIVSAMDSATSKPKVLLVDDKPENLLALSVLLKPLQYELIEASSGREALQYLENNTVAVIVLDVQMPIMDGFESARRMRINPLSATTPILFVTALDRDDKYIERAYELGGTDFITKPINENILISKIKFFVELFEKTAQLQIQSLILRDSAEQERAILLENSLDAVVGADAENKVVYWNKHAELIFGWKKEEVLGHDMADLIVPESYREHHRRGMNRFLTTGIAKIQNQRIEVPALRKGGEEFPVELTVTSIKTTEGFRFYSFVRDITEKVIARRADTELKTQKDLLLSITNNAASSLFMMDQHSHPIFMNPAAEKLTGYTLDEIKDEPLHFAIHYKKPDGSPYPIEECPIDNAKTQIKTLQSEDMFSDKNGRLFPVSYSVAPIELGNGRIGSVLEFRDISEQKRAESELLAAKNEAERANKLKSAFLANMSHEIRTPLGAMLGFADLLRDPGLSKTEHANYIDILTRNGEQLSVIINDILDLSKVEAGHLTLEYTKTHPDEIATDVVSLLQVKAKEKDLALEFNMDPGTPKTIVTDPVRLRQILLNIVGNSIKFTQFGSVKVTSYGCKNEAGRPSVCFEIADTGIGIPADQVDRVFEMFVQADVSMTRKFGGTGLGLALSRRLARSLGGNVEVSKTVAGKGTTFLITIENQSARENTESVIPTEQPAPSQTWAENELEGISVLVVDDAPDNQQLIWHFLNRHGAIVDSAENGLVGYRKALAGNYDIVLMDIQMPEMDGYTATEKLRVAGFQKPIIALTAHAMTEVRKKCMNVGCTDHLSKPINFQQLIGTISKYTEKRPSDRSLSNPPL
ncbi:MAG: response regulator [Bdellovibrionota bacterium]